MCVLELCARCGARSASTTLSSKSWAFARIARQGYYSSGKKDELLRAPRPSYLFFAGGDGEGMEDSDKALRESMKVAAQIRAEKARLDEERARLQKELDEIKLKYVKKVAGTEIS